MSEDAHGPDFERDQAVIAAAFELCNWQFLTDYGYLRCVRQQGHEGHHKGKVSEILWCRQGERHDFSV